jgi:hypothetical protein
MPTAPKTTLGACQTPRSTRPGTTRGRGRGWDKRGLSPFVPPGTGLAARTGTQPRRRGGGAAGRRFPGLTPLAGSRGSRFPGLTPVFGSTGPVEGTVPGFDPISRLDLGSNPGTVSRGPGNGRETGAKPGTVVPEALGKGSKAGTVARTRSGRAQRWTSGRGRTQPSPRPPSSRLSSAGRWGESGQPPPGGTRSTSPGLDVEAGSGQPSPSSFGASHLITGR